MILDWVAIQSFVNSMENNRRRNVSMEKTIAQNGQVAYMYALRILHGPFPEAEASIAKMPIWAVKYARFIIKKRFKIAEKFISRDPERCYEYYKHVIKKKLPSRMHEAMILMSYEDPSNHFVNKYFKEVFESTT